MFAKFNGTLIDGPVIQRGEGNTYIYIWKLFRETVRSRNTSIYPTANLFPLNGFYINCQESMAKINNVL